MMEFFSRWRTLGQALVVCCLGVSLAACSMFGGWEHGRRRSSADDFFVVSDGSPHRVKHGPLVGLPNSGSVTALNEQWFDNGIEQRIRFEGPNVTTRAEISVVLGIDRHRGNALSIEKPNQSGISNELERISQDEDFEVISPTHNQYGVMGIAIGGHCVYAWQWLDDIRELNTGLPSLASGEMPASLRVLHCNKTARSANALIADLQHLTLSQRGQRGDPGHRQLPSPESGRSFEQPLNDPYAVPQSRSPAETSSGGKPLVNPIPNPNGLSPDQRYLAPQQSPGQPAPNTAPVPKPNGGASLNHPRYLIDGQPVTGDKVLLNGNSPTPAFVQRLGGDQAALSGSTPPPFGW